MVEKSFTVLDLLGMELQGKGALNIKCVGGRKGLSRQIHVSEISSPGLALAGFFENFLDRSIQVFGLSECALLKKLISEGKTESLDKFFGYDFPCVVFTSGFAPKADCAEFLKMADRAACPALQTDLTASEFSMRFMRVCNNKFAPRKTMHGVMVEVFGIGILLTGHSGVGKSECALELIQRGHRLVADDIVEMRCVNGNSVVAQGANALISHHMEIRGLGIINVSQLYGIGSIRERKEVQFVIKLEEWNPAKLYDRIGTNRETMDILGVPIPAIEIPVRPGRNLPIIIEAAAMNERLKSKGYDSARDFNQNILKWIETGEASATYYGTDDFY